MAGKYVHNIQVREKNNVNNCVSDIPYVLSKVPIYYDHYVYVQTNGVWV